MLPDHIKAAIDVYIPALGEWMKTEQAYQMAELIIETKPKVVVEIGVFKGQSLTAQAFALRNNNDGGKIYGIDPWSKERAVEGGTDPANDEWWTKKIDLDQICNDCMKNIRDHRLEEWVVIIRSASQFCYDLFPRIDQLYIDGCHSELASTRDVINYAPRVKEGGYIFMDDCDWSTTQKAVRMIEEQCEVIQGDGNFRLYRKK